MITILGASGFIGSHLARKLAAGGAEYRAIGRNDRLRDENLGNVIYCIGATADFRRRPFYTVEAHVCALMEFIKRYQFESLLYLSSTRVYADDESSNEEKPLRVSPHIASDLFNISKAMGESIVLTSAHRACVARVSNVYGPDFDSDNFLPSIVRQALSGEKLVLHTAAESAKDYISVDDVVNALIQIATRGREEIYNVASGVNVSHRALVDKLRALTGCEVEFEANAPVAKFPPIDVERLQSDFPFTPSSVLDDLPQLVESYKKALVK
jgi:nucleoside-diphosphate-sugar epimerase